MSTAHFCIIDAAYDKVTNRAAVKRDRGDLTSEHHEILGGFFFFFC